ncbi:MAG TPA: nitrous oxide reductase accessory protein NosL [Dissulfurispiraceae bacterium]|nr:nitrous oxide reductase accessory protein NosL [Dissulfurispiraceae bacterium]
MNKRIIFGISALLMVFCLGIAVAQAAVEGIQSCKYCGMDREKFGHSRMYIEYDDGMKVGLCSLHCAAVDLALNIDKNPKEIKVADFNTKDLVDAEKAVWVVGGNKMGVMTKRAKWAFAKKEDAEKFVKDNGGKISSFDEAIKAAYEDMYEDSKMIREKRKMMKMKGSEHKHH